MSGRFRRFVAAGAALGVATGIVAISTAATARSHPQLTERQILRIALRAAAVSGDPRPSLIQHSEGMHSKANQVASGGSYGGGAWSYLIAERGKFVFNNAPVPFGAPPPGGSVITLIVNTATARVTDDGISYRYPPLAQLGPVTTDFRSYPSCPATDRQQLTSTTPGADKRLVPSGARQVLLCRYGGLNAGRLNLRLVAHRLGVNRQTLGQLTAELDRLKPFHPGAYACPADFGVKIIAFFRYSPSPRADNPLTLDPNGCEGVTNGHLVRTALLAPGPKLIQQLEQLTTPPALR